MKLDFKSIFSQSSLIIRANIREIIILTIISSLFVFLTTKMSQLIEQVKDIPSLILAFFAALSPLLFLISCLLILFIVINKESGLSVSYLKMIRYILTRLISLAATNLLNWFIVFFGFLLLFVPGVIWYFTYSQAYLFALIDGMGPIKSLKASKIATNKNKWQLFNLFFLFGLIYGVPIELFSLLHLPITFQLPMQVFIFYLSSITNYVIWKTLKQNMNSQNLA